MRGLGAAAVALGIFLARRMEVRLKAISSAVEQVASGDESATAQSPQAYPMPAEFAGVFEAVTALSDRLRASESARKQLLANVVHEVARPLGQRRHESGVDPFGHDQPA